MKTTQKRLLNLLAALAIVASTVFIPGSVQVAIAEGEEGAEQTEQTENAEEAKKPDVWLQISPVSNRVTLEAGKTFEYTMTVENIGAKAFSYKVYAAPYSVTSGSYEINFSNETPRTQITRWISFKDKDGSWTDGYTAKIKPGKKQTVEYRVVVPDDIPEGGQYATIFAESIPSSDSTSGSTTGIKTVSRVGLVIYARTNGTTNENAEITDHYLTNFLTEGSIDSGAKITNAGNTDFEATYSLVVKSLFGKTLYEKSIVNDVLPDTSRDVQLTWEDTPLFGIFHVTSGVTALSQTDNKVKIVLVIPVFMIIITIILLTILVAWLIILVKRRKDQKSRLIV